MTSPPEANAQQRIVVVGHGMVSHRFCELLSVRSRAFHITVFGKENVPVYDRVHLGALFEQASDGSKLSLSSPAWYAERSIDLFLGEEVTHVDRTSQNVVSAEGRKVPYDLLVLATGARARRPKIEGLPRDVLVYRTQADVERLRDVCAVGRSVAILGGGLLGLECADALRRRGAKVSVYEASESLLPRQLDAASAAVLKRRIERLGLPIETGYRLLRVEPRLGGGYRLYAESAAVAECDVLVAATGVEAEDGLARAASLALGPLGGVSVSDALVTSDPNIFAIGDCAAHRGITPGLIAPGYDMAEVLVARLCGDATRVFGGISRTCQLKLSGVEVSALGRYDLEASHHTFKNENVARTLVVHQGKLVGATLVGAWDERFHVQRAVEEEATLSERQLARFERSGSLGFARRPLPVAEWPPAAIVCQCAKVTRGQISELACSTGGSLAAVQEHCRAGTICGSCAPLLSELFGTSEGPPRMPYARLTGVVSALLFVAVLVFALLPSLPVSASVRHARYAVEALWRSSLFRQITGYTVVGLFLVGLLLSARKRLAWFRWGSFAGYRALHTLLGLLSVVALCVHTGLRFGAHLNFALMSVFVGSAVFGGFAGISAALEGHAAVSARARALRGTLSRIHLWLLWPLPALLAFHILAAYYF